MKRNRLFKILFIIALIVPTITITMSLGFDLDPGGGGGGDTSQPAIVKGTVFASDHGNAKLQYATVVLKAGSITLGSDTTDSNGYYEITTSPFSSQMYISLKVTYTKNGFFGVDHWIIPETQYFTIVKGNTYTKYFYVEDRISNMDVSFTLKYSAYTHFYFTAHWTNNYDPYNVEALVILTSWECSIISSSSATHWFRFEAYKAVPYSSANYLGYSFVGTFEIIDETWNTLSGTCSVQNTDIIYLASEVNPCWQKVIWDSINGDTPYAGVPTFPVMFICW